MKRLRTIPARFEITRYEDDTRRVKIVTDDGVTMTYYGGDIHSLYDQAQRDYKAGMMDIELSDKLHE